jgi:hypothetical protein
VTATYTWSGFKGRDGSVDAEIRLYMNGSLEGSGSSGTALNPSGGSITSTFGTDTSAASNQFHVDGRLTRLNSGKTVRGSDRKSGVETHPCFAD